eukprot:373863-Prymnesium_polylepis.1
MWFNGQRGTKVAKNTGCGGARRPWPDRPAGGVARSARRSGVGAVGLVGSGCAGRPWRAGESPHRFVCICGRPIWDFLCVPARYVTGGAQRPIAIGSGF